MGEARQLPCPHARSDWRRCPHCNGINTPEPAPVPTDGTPIWDLVIADMRERDQEGRRKYGTPLQAGNGRDTLVDAYHEALDLGPVRQ